MTDAPSPAADAAPPAGRPRPPVASRPDERLALLEAIQRRDALRSRRLAERWVHRHGLVSLEAFQRTSLQTLEGPAGCAWLRDLLELPPAPAPAAPLPSVEEAFAALAAEFAGSAPALVSAPPPTPAELEPIAADGRDQVEASLLPPSPTPLPFATAPAAEACGEEIAVPSGESLPESEQAQHAGSGAATPDSTRRSWPGRSLGRVGSLLRACVEEAISGLHPGGGASPATDAAFRDPALPASGLPEPLAPLPAFHPTDSILAALPEAPAPAPLPQRWFPRLGLVAPARRPAPAPADLADLRAWLPDGADDLPRAC
ncbi:MAG: hypothetical protein VKJ05_06430 [Synechococcaceae cyanobacterium]|nr:hypothetical protein [Synechococcaceae cyanobacterium]